MTVKLFQYKTNNENCRSPTGIILLLNHELNELIKHNVIISNWWLYYLLNNEFNQLSEFIWFGKTDFL